MIRSANRTRRGAIVPLTALSLTALLGIVALCIDLSVIALAKTQCQNAADMAAMASARALDGVVSTNNNSVVAFSKGNAAAAGAVVMGKAVNTNQVTIKIGTFTYSGSSFQAANLTGEAPAGTSNPSYPPPAGYNWGLAQADITSTVNYSFARIFGLTSMPVSATATAIHRPRDAAIIMDYSGSMAFDSYLARPKSGPPGRQNSTTYNPPYASLNNDTRVPGFGHYHFDTPFLANSTDPTYTSAYLVNSLTPSPYTGDYERTDSQELLKIGNQTAETAAGKPIVEDFLTLNAGGSLVPAFIGGTASTPVTAFDADKFPTAIPNWSGSLGDRPLQVNSTPTRNLLNTSSTFSYTASSPTAYAKNCLEIYTPVLTATTPNATVNVSTDIKQNEYETFATSGTMYPATSAGFTYGPGYWGKTFFKWPPEPDATANSTVAISTTATNATIRDWRQRFFWAVRSDNSGKKRLDDNNVLYLSDGSPRNPTSTYTDAAGLGWKWQPNYEAILYWLANTGPNPFPSNLRCGRLIYWESIPTTVASSSSNMDQLFWKEFIDWCVGFQGYRTNGSGMNLFTGHGNDFTWQTSSATAQINPKPTGWQEIGRLNASYSSGRAANSAINVKTASYSTTSTTMLNWDPPANTQIRFGSATSGTIYTIKSVTKTANQWDIRLNQSLSAGISNGATIFANVPLAYMDYRDNPKRPKQRLWFGPAAFCDFIFGEFEDSSGKWRYWRPGTCHEAPMWVLKSGIQSALKDIEKNHPNDWVSLIYFSVPMESSTDSSNSSRFNRVRGALGKNYTYMQNALWYPPAVLNTDGTLLGRTETGGEFRPYTSTFGVDSRFRENPYASGGTTPMWGLTLAYNQLSSNATLRTADVGQPTGMAGGNGRLGARKLVVLETDGVPNHTATSSFVGTSAGQCYYDCSPGMNKYPNVTSVGNMAASALTGAYEVTRVICDNSSGTTSGTVAAYMNTTSSTNIARATGKPGYSTPGKPVLVHALAFGGLFESESDLKPQCLGFLQTIQTFGNVQSSPTTALSSDKIITGTSTERIDKIKTAFTNIMQDGVQITLYK